MTIITKGMGAIIKKSLKGTGKKTKGINLNKVNLSIVDIKRTI